LNVSSSNNIQNITAQLQAISIGIGTS